MDLFTSGMQIVRKKNCEDCYEVKQTRLPFPNEGSRTGGLLEIIHSDVCESIKKKSIGGSKYVLTFIHIFKDKI